MVGGLVGRWVSGRWSVGRWLVGKWLVDLIKPEWNDTYTDSADK